MHPDCGVYVVSVGVLYGDLVDMGAAGKNAMPPLPQLDAVAATL